MSRAASSGGLPVHLVRYCSGTGKVLPSITRVRAGLSTVSRSIQFFWPVAKVRRSRRGLIPDAGVPPLLSDRSLHLWPQARVCQPVSEIGRLEARHVVHGRLVYVSLTYDERER